MARANLGMTDPEKMATQGTWRDEAIYLFFFFFFFLF